MIKIFADTSDIKEIKELNEHPLIQGFTTNPTLMRKAGVTDYERFCKEVLAVTGKPVSFEVFADEFDEMERQAWIISSWGENVYVKIPIMNTKGQSTKQLTANLAVWKGIKLNITAIMRYEQIGGLSIAITNDNEDHILSIFAGRISDTGINPIPCFQKLRSGCGCSAQILWASTREVLNIYQAEEAGADIITVTPEIFRKYEAMKNKDLQELSLDTVKQFFFDGKEAGFTL